MTSSLLDHLQRPRFQIRSHLQILGIGTSTCFLVGVGHNSTHNRVYEVFCLSKVDMQFKRLKTSKLKGIAPPR